MSHYLEKLDAHLGNVRAAAMAEDDPHRSRILWNYLHHGALEVGGDWERIFEPDMTVDTPHYEMRAGTEETLVLDGQDEVKAFYAAVEDENMFLVDDGDHQLFVNDEGLAEFATTVEFATGRAILDEDTDAWFYRDVEVDDPDATYVKTCRHGMFWPYTEDALLVGERVYQLDAFEVEKADPAEVPALEESRAVAERYYPENVDGPTPF